VARDRTRQDPVGREVAPERPDGDRDIRKTLFGRGDEHEHEHVTRVRARVEIH
jgi:hypothetical protein